MFGVVFLLILNDDGEICYVADQRDHQYVLFSIQLLILATILIYNFLFDVCFSHSYDLIGGNFLVWSDQAKIAPPPLYATLRLQHVSEEGWQILQEIKALGAWNTNTSKSSKKSKRKQTPVRRISQVKVEEEEDDNEEIEIDFDTYESPFESEESEPNETDDEDYDPLGDDACYEYDDDIETKPKRPVRQTRKASTGAGKQAKGSESPASPKVRLFTQLYHVIPQYFSLLQASVE